MENSTFGNRSSGFGTPPPDDGLLINPTAGIYAAGNPLADAAEVAERATRKAKGKPTIDQVAAMAHQAVDKAAASAAPAVDWIGEQSESLKSTQKKLVTDTCAYIAANPLMSVGMAVVAGFFISRIMRNSDS